MPIYEYQCKKCGNIFEEWAKNFDTLEHISCPKCGEDAQKLISNTSFVLKGGGWYVTEYGNKKSAIEEKDTSSATEKSEKPAETSSSTEDKPKASTTSPTTSATPSSKTLQDTTQKKSKSVVTESSSVTKGSSTAVQNNST